MKFLKILLVSFCCVWMTSCLEINEDVEIKENGSGRISTTTDLSQLVDMLAGMGGDEFEKMKNEKIDTLIEMRKFVDTASNLNAEQKSLLKNGKIRMKMNMTEKVFNINVEFPFDNMEKYQQLNTLLNSQAGGMGNIMKNIMSGKSADKNPNEITDQPAPASPDMDQLSMVFDFNSSNGLIKKTLNAEKYKKLMDDPQVQQLKQGADMGMEILYTTTFKLPRPIKKVDNAAAKLSDDKKTVTIRQNMLEIFTAPEKFEYTIQY